MKLSLEKIVEEEIMHLNHFLHIFSFKINVACFLIDLQRINELITHIAKSGDLKCPRLLHLQKIIHSPFFNSVREVYEHIYQCTSDIEGPPEVGGWEFFESILGIQFWRNRNLDMICLNFIPATVTYSNYSYIVYYTL